MHDFRKASDPFMYITSYCVDFFFFLQHTRKVRKARRRRLSKNERTRRRRMAQMKMTRVEMKRKMSTWMMSRRERMKERKRMLRTEKQDCFIWSVRPGFYQPLQMVVSTLVVGQVMRSGQTYGTQNMLLFVI